MKIDVVEIEKPDDMNFILGQSHFIMTVEDIYEALVSSVPGIEFGMAFCEASAKRLIRVQGNAADLMSLAVRNMERIAAGHTFIIMLRKAYPINVLRALRQVPEVVNVYCATANPTKVVIASDGEGRGVLGVIDGLSPVGVETEQDMVERKEFLRRMGYKL